MRLDIFDRVIPTLSLAGSLPTMPKLRSTSASGG